MITTAIKKKVRVLKYQLLVMSDALVVKIPNWLKK
jgi:hypothetical protein